MAPPPPPAAEEEEEYEEVEEVEYVDETASEEEAEVESGPPSRSSASASSAPARAPAPTTSDGAGGAAPSQQEADRSAGVGSAPPPEEEGLLLALADGFGFVPSFERTDTGDGVLVDRAGVPGEPGVADREFRAAEAAVHEAAREMQEVGARLKHGLFSAIGSLGIGGSNGSSRAAAAAPPSPAPAAAAGEALTRLAGQFGAWWSAPDTTVSPAAAAAASAPAGAPGGAGPRPLPPPPAGLLGGPGEALLDEGFACALAQTYECRHNRFTPALVQARAAAAARRCTRTLPCAHAALLSPLPPARA